MTIRAGRALGTVVFGVLVVVAAAVCVRLGIWQLDRLAQRRAYNASVAARFTSGAEPLAAALGRDTAEARWRRVSARVVPDYTREVVVSSRSRNGSPGVWIVTPARQLTSDTLVAFVRGWVYSANGRTVDLAPWREADTVTVDGLLDAFHRPATGAVRLPSDARAFRWLERDTLAAEWQAPVAAMLVYQLGDTIGGHSATGGTVPARFPVPSMDEGPHRSYAIQWFSFATVFVVGYAAVIVTGRRRAHAAA
jgi:surfeit locus 1 family protein